MLKNIIEALVNALTRYNACIKLESKDAAYTALAQYQVLKEVLQKSGYSFMGCTRKTETGYIFVSIHIGLVAKQEECILTELGFELTNDKIGCYTLVA